jgi:hypothetical protein
LQINRETTKRNYKGRRFIVFLGFHEDMVETIKRSYKDEIIKEGYAFDPTEATKRNYKLDNP